MTKKSPRGDEELTSGEQLSLFLKEVGINLDSLPKVSDHDRKSTVESLSIDPVKLKKTLPKNILSTLLGAYESFEPSKSGELFKKSNKELIALNTLLLQDATPKHLTDTARELVEILSKYRVNENLKLRGTQLEPFLKEVGLDLSALTAVSGYDRKSTDVESLSIDTAKIKEKLPKDIMSMMLVANYGFIANDQYKLALETDLIDLNKKLLESTTPEYLTTTANTYVKILLDYGVYHKINSGFKKSASLYNEASKFVEGNFVETLEQNKWMVKILSKLASNIEFSSERAQYTAEMPKEKFVENSNKAYELHQIVKKHGMPSDKEYAVALSEIGLGMLMTKRSECWEKIFSVCLDAIIIIENLLEKTSALQDTDDLRTSYYIVLDNFADVLQRVVKKQFKLPDSVKLDKFQSMALELATKSYEFFSSQSTWKDLAKKISDAHPSLVKSSEQPVASSSEPLGTDAPLLGVASQTASSAPHATDLAPSRQPEAEVLGEADL